jgi:RimJ/RimL family protein N-acetyltransferase
VNEPAEIYQTERLLVRHITDGDVDAMHAVYGDAVAMQWVDDGQPLDRQGCMRWIAVTKRNYATRGYGMSALVLKHYAAERLDLRRVIATTAPENEASQRVLLKVGMSHLETTRDEDGSCTKTFVWLAGNP